MMRTTPNRLNDLDFIDALYIVMIHPKIKMIRTMRSPIIYTIFSPIFSDNYQL